MANDGNRALVVRVWSGWITSCCYCIVVTCKSVLFFRGVCLRSYFEKVQLHIASASSQAEHRLAGRELRNKITSNEWHQFDWLDSLRLWLTHQTGRKRRKGAWDRERSFNKLLCTGSFTRNMIIIVWKINEHHYLKAHSRRHLDGHGWWSFDVVVYVRTFLETIILKGQFFLALLVRGGYVYAFYKYCVSCLQIDFLL